MPELPEVETIKLGLQRKITGLTLKNIEVLSPKIFQGDPKDVEGKKVVGVWRRAKILGIDLGSSVLLFHLKMTGQLIFVGAGERLIGGHPTEDMKNQMPIKSTRVIFEFNDGSKLYFNDLRRFGWVKVVDSSEFMVHGEGVLGNLGPEPFDKDFTWEILKKNLFRHKGMPVKVAILDQSVVSGIGNIYASESLFDAQIDPRKKVIDLSDAEFKKLYQGIKKSLETGIKHGGSTRAHFVNIDGEKGYFLDYASVYGRAGQPCKKCQGKIIKIQQAGRGTYFCPSCQK